MPGGWEWLIIIVVLVVLFGAKRLPEMARSVGQSARVFKGEMKGMRDDEGHNAAQGVPRSPSTEAGTRPAEPARPAALPPVTEQVNNPGAPGSSTAPETAAPLPSEPVRRDADR